MKIVGIRLKAGISAGMIELFIVNLWISKNVNLNEDMYITKQFIK